MTDHYEARQIEYDRKYEERRNAERPRPALEMSAILEIAAQCENDPAALEAFHFRVTPAQLILAHQAQVWDRRNPWYACIACRDGDSVPSGYICRACGQ